MRVLLPLVLPGILVAAIFSAIFIWNEFLVGLYVINSEDQKTVPIGAAGLISAQRPIDWDVAATVGVVTMVPLLFAPSSSSSTSCAASPPEPSSDVDGEP